jgi:phospholipid/cholesterol/gamma-HCH transport system substrate-binding protein
MKISSEAKIGLIGIATLAILIWGINYLKGRNILNRDYTLHAYFEDAGGLEKSSPVFMHGIKVGYIDAIEMLQGQAKPIHVTLNVVKKYPVQGRSTAILYSADLLGTRAVRIESSGTGDLLEHNDTILALIETDMLSSLSSQVMPVMEQIGNLAISLDSTVQKIDRLLKSESTAGALQDLREITASLSSALHPGGALYESFDNLGSFSSVLEARSGDIDSTIIHLKSISAALDSAGIDRIAGELLVVTGEINQLLQQLNSGEGSMGRLVYSDSLYVQLQHLVNGLDSLVIDLQENPKDYVHFSLFGK